MSHSRFHSKTLLGLAAFGLALLGLAGPAAAEPRPSSDVLVPYFEVALDPTQGLSTLFSVCNGSDDPVDVMISVHTNWGIPILNMAHVLKPDEVHTVNLRDWLVNGRLLDRVMTPEELAHVQAALSGKPSPQDGLWYGTEVVPGRATGYVTIRTTGVQRPDVLWGDYFLVDPAAECFQGETLVNIDFHQCDVPCTRHVVRFLDGGPFEDGTELVIWNEDRWAPSPQPEPLDEKGVKVRGLSYDEPGRFLARREMSLRPVQVVRVSELALPEPFGWLDITTEGPSFIGVRFTATVNHTSSALHSYCVSAEAGGDLEGPAIRLRKRINGAEESQPPGLSLPIGTPILWEYEVDNTGSVLLTNIVVEDDTGVVVTCPGDALEAGASMVCTASGTAEPCEHVNVGTVSALAPDGTLVSDESRAWYTGSFQAEVRIEKAVNGEDADQAPGPSFQEGAPLQWTFTVTNAGDVPLTGVTVTDDFGLSVTCPKTSLQPGETMTCTAGSTAVAGSHTDVAVAKGKPPCGPEVTASDPVHFYVPPRSPGIDLEKLVNGQEADAPPYPSLRVGDPVLWTFVVTNTGDIALTQVTVTDSQGVAVTCPKAALSPGESMTCVASGIAVAGTHTNTGTATGRALGATVTASDPATYVAEQPAISLEKRVNGDDADLPPGPTIFVGSSVLWTFVVTNTGDVQLTNVVLTDEGTAVVCPKSVLAPGEVMTCSTTGTAIHGQYHNTATVAGTPPVGTPLTASDPAYYLGVVPGISLEKLVNGQDADDPPGVLVLVCTTLQWTYLVTNTGEVALQNVSVVDDQAAAGKARAVVPGCPNPIPFLGVTCPKTTLAVGESMTCTASSTAEEAGQHLNIATARGTPVPGGAQVSDDDPAYYTAVNNFQGCTPGYWKNHTGSWPSTGYTTGQSVLSVFAASVRFPALADDTLLQALAYGGGSGDQGAAEILLRAGVAALLNAAHPSVAYPRTPASVIADVNAALAGTRDQMLALAAALDADNNRGCPLH